MAGSLTNAAETKLLELLFNNSDWANIGDAGGLQNSASAGSFYVSLFTAAPSDSAAGTECDYTDYARVGVARSGAGWTVSGNNATNAAAVTFPTAGVTAADVAVAFGIHTASTSGDLIFWGDITSPAGGLTIDDGITPIFAAGELDINVD
jgi:phage baseplate assembly protein gpV